MKIPIFNLARTRYFFALFFLLFLCLSPSAKAAETEWLGSLAPRTLDSEAEANAWAAQVIQDYGPSTDENPKTLEVLHIRGQQISPYLEHALSILVQKGYRLTGTFLSPEEFDAASASVPVSQRIQYTKDSFIDRRKLRSRLFGLPQGLTILAHLGTWRQKRDSRVFRFANWATLTTFLTTAACRYFVFPHYIGEPMPSWQEFTATTSFILLWSYLFLYFRPEWLKVKQDGVRIARRPSAGHGQQISAHANRVLFNTFTLGNEAVSAAVITAILYAFDQLPGNGHIHWGHVIVDAGATAVASTFSYSAFEDRMGEQFKEAEKLEEVDPAKAAKIKRSIQRWSSFFYMVPYAIAINAARFFKSIYAKNLPLVALGVAGAAWATYQDPTRNSELETKLWDTYRPDLPCSVAIAVH